MKSLAKENLFSDDEIKTLLRSQTNNHHVVPLGILIVLCTMYLMAAGLQRNYIYYLKPGVAAFNLPSTTQTDAGSESKPQPSCPKLEIFKKDISEPVSDTHDNPKTPEMTSSQAKSPKRSKIPKNGKQLENRKKDQAKKSNTAEPIIYLFALVFIYLLLKAASDINQHYKSQNKGDKRLRRCSLQSYAQAHKQDRRASKVAEDSPLLQRRQALLKEVRSISVDRYKYTIVEEGAAARYQPMPLHNSAVVGGGDAPMHLNRRSSVPININHTAVQILRHPPELVKRGSVISLSNLAPLATSEPISTLPDSTKRRVRMINRH